MTHSIRAMTLGGTMFAAFCLATLIPAASNEAAAQLFRPGIRQAYYGYGNVYSNGYGNVYNNGYGNYAPSGYGYSGAVYSNYGYSGYGNGLYGYGSSPAYSYPNSVGYGYSNGTPYNTYYRNSPYDGATYRRIYTSNYGTYYSPY